MGEKNHLVGATAVVTGGNSGVGLATARLLAQTCSRVIIGSRSAAANAQAVAALRCANPCASVEAVTLDLTKEDSIRSFVRSVKDGVDVLVNNAGAAFKQSALCDDGLEKTYSTNLVGHFRLTRELLPRLVDSPRGRIVWVSSPAYRVASIDASDLDRPWSGRAGWRHYSAVKLGTLLVAQRLDEVLCERADRARSVAVNPGVVGSAFLTHHGTFDVLPLSDAVAAQVSSIMPDPARAAELVVQAASLGEFRPRGVVERAYLGGLWGPGAVRRPVVSSKQAAMGTALWGRLEEMCGVLPLPKSETA